MQPSRLWPGATYSIAVTLSLQELHPEIAQATILGAGATTPCALSEYAGSFGSTGVPLRHSSPLSRQFSMCTCVQQR